MKRTYIHPKMIAVKLQNQSHLMEGTTLSGVNTTGLYSGDDEGEDESINYNAGGINGSARVKGTNIWDNEW